MAPPPVPTFNASSLGSGDGFIYVTLPDGVSIVSNIENTSSAWYSIQQFAASSSSITSDTVDSDPNFGYRFFGNETGSAGDLTGADEITNLIVGRDIHSAAIQVSDTIATGVSTVLRPGHYWLLNLDTQGGAGTDDLDTLTVIGVVAGDTVTIVGADATHIVTVKNGTGNIHLVNSQDFSTGAKSVMITLKYLSGAWYEQVRSNTLPTVTNQRASSVAIPIQGVNSADMGTSGTVTYTVGTSKQYQLITGSPVMVGNTVFTTAGGTLDGDTFTAYYRATPTLGGNTVTIFGITLTATQSNQSCVITTVYKLSNTTWYSTLYVNGNAIDFATTTQLATKEDLLPASGGDTFVLQKTIAGVYSFVPNGGASTILTATINLSTADLLTLNSVPVEAVPAPGAGLAIELVSASIKYTYGVATFTANEVQLVTDTAANIQADTATILSVAASTFVRFFIQQLAGVQLVANKALKIKSGADGSGGVPTGSAKVYVAYRVITV